MFSDKQVIAVSGHKSASSLAIYGQVTMMKKFAMEISLGHKLLKLDQPAIEPPPEQLAIMPSQGQIAAPANLNLPAIHFRPTCKSTTTCSNERKCDGQKCNHTI